MRILASVKNGFSISQNESSNHVHQTPTTTTYVEINFTTHKQQRKHGKIIMHLQALSQFNHNGKNEIALATS